MPNEIFRRTLKNRRIRSSFAIRNHDKNHSGWNNAPYASWKPSFRLTANFRFTTPRSLYPSRSRSTQHPFTFLPFFFFFLIENSIPFDRLLPGSHQTEEKVHFLYLDRGGERRMVDSRMNTLDSLFSRILPRGSRRGIRLEPVLIREDRGWIVWILNGVIPATVTLVLVL